MSNTPRWDSDYNWKNDIERKLTETQLRLSRSIDVPEVAYLPEDPYQWQEVFYRCPAAPYSSWHLRWNQNWGDEYSWEFIGGSALYVEQNADNTFTVSASWQDAATNPGPSYTLPLGGIFDVAFTANMYIASQSAQTTLYTGLAIDASTPAGTGIYATDYAIAGIPASPGRTVRIGPVDSGTVLKQMYLSSIGATPHTRSRSMTIMPVRVGS